MDSCLGVEEVAVQCDYFDVVLGDDIILDNHSFKQKLVGQFLIM